MRYVSELLHHLVSISPRVHRWKPTSLRLELKVFFSSFPVCCTFTFSHNISYPRFGEWIFFQFYHNVKPKSIFIQLNMKCEPPFSTYIHPPHIYPWVMWSHTLITERWSFKDPIVESQPVDSRASLRNSANLELGLQCPCAKNVLNGRRAEKLKPPAAEARCANTKIAAVG